jgi:two-component system, cell cycle response regulator DivK
MANEPVLIIDDNAMNLKLEKILLELENYLVQTAMDTQEARGLLNYFHPRLILMDFQLPGEDGLAFTKELKADPKNKDIIILMATSYDQKGSEEKARAAGCDGYITKPIDTQALPVQIAGYLRPNS